MFSTAEKRRIAAAVEQVLRDINHPEMDPEHIAFTLHVQGREWWSFADIHPNGQPRVPQNPDTARWNEQARSLLGEKGDA